MAWLALAILLFLPGVANAKPNLPGPSLVAPILVDENPTEDAWVFPHSHGRELRVEAEPVIAVLRKYLLEPTLVSLQSRVSPDGTFSLKDLAAVGVHGQFDEIKLEFQLTIPPELRQSSVHTIVNRGAQPQGKVFGPSDFSGKINFRTTQSFLYPDSGTASARQPFIGNLSPDINYKGWVLSSGATYTEHNPSPWKREDTTLYRDDEEHMLRFAAGDQQTPVAGYLSGRSIGGLGVSRVYAIQPYTTAQPVSRTELLLKRASIVEVFVNGVLQNQMRLPAGPVNVQDFPLANGLNRVELRITDDLGRVEMVDLSLYYDQQLLGRGNHQFSYHMGAPFSDEEKRRSYDDDNFNFSGYHRYGVTDTFTSGLFAQRDLHSNIVGLEEFLATRFGTFTFTAARNKIASLDPDFAGKLRYQTLDAEDGRLRFWRFQTEAEYKGWRFATVGTPIASNPYGWTSDSNLLFRIPHGVDLGLGATYQFKRAANVDRVQGRTDLSYTFLRNWRASVNYSYTHDTRPEQRAFLSLTWIDSAGKYYANATHDTSTHTTRLDVSRNPEQAYNDVRLAAGVQNSPAFRQASAQVEYVANRALVRLDHLSTIPRDGRSTSHLSTLNLNSALVWAGGTFALSRPVSDSFAILIPEGAAEKNRILANPEGTSAEAELGGFMPGVLPSMNSYYYVPVSLDTSALPLGVSIKDEYFSVKPTFRSGTRIPVRGESALIVSGFVVDAKGKPLTLLSGDLQSGTGEPIVFFTNRRGQFVIENLQPGTYTMRFYEGDWRPISVTVPENARGFIKLGPLKAKKGSE